jgi:hypothetical protein
MAEVIGVNSSNAYQVRPRLLRTAVVLWVSSFIIYQTAFLHTPRLFLFPRSGLSFSDIHEYAPLLRGWRCEWDMYKHLLYKPVSRPLYRLANWARLRFAVTRDTAALVFPEALCGAFSVVLGYILFLRFMKSATAAAVAAAVYAYTYSVWLFASVTETYALTVLCVNLFLCVAVAKKIELSKKWYVALTGLLALCCLCDLRSLFLVSVPLYIIVSTRGVKRAQHIGGVLLLTTGAVVLVGTTYELFRYITGHAGFGIRAMSQWLPHYGRSFMSLGSVHSVLQTLLIFFVGSLSPLHPEQMNQSPQVLFGIQTFLACCFSFVYGILILGALRDIGNHIKTSLHIQALVGWLLIYVFYHIFYASFSAVLFSRPSVLPLLLIVVPGVAGAWRRRRGGTALMAACVVLMLVNNLLVINEARVSWQRPAILQSDADRIYLLPGEIEREQFLRWKALSLCSEAEKARVAVLSARAPHALTTQEREELIELTQRGITHLTPSEREQLRDIMYRCHEAVKLARGGT